MDKPPFASPHHSGIPERGEGRVTKQADFTPQPGSQAEFKLNGMTKQELSLILRTPAPGCPACEHHDIHFQEDWLYHPHAGHGFTPESGWTHPDLGKAK